MNRKMKPKPKKPITVLVTISDDTNKMLRAWMPMNNHTNKGQAIADILRKYFK